MALTVNSSGTTAALTIGVETTLATLTPGTPTVYCLRVDGGALASGEKLDVVAYSKTLTGGTERYEMGWEITGGSNPVTLMTPPIPCDISLRFGVTQVNGTGRTVPWKIYSL